MAFRQPSGSAAHRAGCGARRGGDSAGPGHAAAHHAGAAQPSHPLSAGAHFPDGGQPVRLSGLEGAPALQPAHRARRAGPDSRRGRGRGATGQGARAQPPMANRRPARRQPCDPGTPAAQHQRARAHQRIDDVDAPLRRAHRDHRAAVGGARGSTSRRRALRRRGRGGADRSFVRRADQRPLEADDDPPRRARRPARPRRGRARQRGLERMAGWPRRDGDRRGRLDRRRALPADRALQARASGALRHLGVRALQRTADPAGHVSASAAVDHRRRRQARLARRAGARPRAAFGGVSRGSVQARPADGRDQRVAGGAQQRVRDLGAGARGRRGQGGQVRARLHRQGGQSDQRHGRVQASGRDHVPEPAERHDAIRHRALRQRVRQRRAASSRAFASRSCAADR